MDIQPFLTEVRGSVTDTFAEVDAWFDQPAALRAYPPADGGWTTDEVLTHIGLTNRYLLILVEKGTAKALANAQNLDLATELAYYQFPREKLATIGVLHAFDWVRPGHMEPREHPQPLPAVRQQLHAQLAQTLACLDRLPHGEGLLYATTMTVNGLGRLNLYEYIYFLAQHARRHLTQMRDNAAEYTAAGVA